MELQQARRRDEHRREQRSRRAAASGRTREPRAQAKQARADEARARPSCAQREARIAADRRQKEAQPQREQERERQRGSARSGARRSSSDQAAGRLGGRPREDLLLDVAPGLVPDVRAGAARSGRRAATTFTWRSAAPRRWAGARRSTRWSPIIPSITWGWLSPPTAAFWAELAKTIRLWVDYLRYFHPDYDRTPNLKARAERAAAAAARVDQPSARSSRTPATGGGSCRCCAGSNGRCRRCRRSSRSCASAVPTWCSSRRSIYLGSSQFEVLRVGAGAGHPHDLRGRQLGSPVQQGAHSRHAAARVRVERHAEGRGRAPARRAARARRRHRRAVLRPMVRPPPGADPRGVLRARRPAGGSAVHPLRVLGAVLGQPRRGGVRAALGAEPARERGARGCGRSPS